MYENIPSELRSLRQWCLWKYEYVQGSEKPTKVPYQPNERHASVNDPSSYSSFDECINRLRADDRYSGLGFIFTVSDPYAGIDLDNSTSNNPALNKQIEIFNKLNSYSEKSPSGLGVHIIVKGSVPTGIKTPICEIYSSGRFFTFTGDVCNAAPIEDRQDLLTQLWNEIKKPENTNENTLLDVKSSIYSDDEITIQCSKAINGDKFSKLFRGEWQGDYPSQSEADFAIIDIIAFYTQDRMQIARLFHKSKLGQRAKAKRVDYLNWMINKSFDNVLPTINIEGFKEALDVKLALVAQRIEQGNSTPKVIGSSPIESTTPVIAASFNGKTTDFDSVNDCSIQSVATIPLPPGLLGEIAQFIYAAAPRPVPEIALAAAIGLMAGICGRAYNISGSGLNQYLLLLAPTGTGKEAISSGIDKLMSAIFSSNPASKDFIGPSDMASGQALVRYLDDSLTKCFVCMMDEFGLRLQRMSDPKANDAQIKLKQTLLELYQRTGKGQVFRPTIFADKQKNTLSSQCPNVTILGYSAPERFYEVLSEDMIVDGVLPRFSIIEYKGLRPAHNYEHHNVFPPNKLVADLSRLAQHSLSQMTNALNGQQWTTVNLDDASEKMHREFNTYCDSIINSTDKSSHKQLWSRAYLKALKLAALIAVGCNTCFPTVTVEYLEYAIQMVCNDIRAIIGKFEMGSVGKNNEEHEQYELLKKYIIEYITSDWNKIKPYASDAKKLHADKIITAQYLATRVGRLAPFKNDKLGATRALERTIKNAIDHGFLIAYNGQVKYNTTRRLFAISPEILN